MTQNIGKHLKIHTMNFLQEIGNNPTCGILKIPLNILRIMLMRVAKRASELNDFELNKIMMQMALYSIADPCDEEYNVEYIEKYLKRKIL